MAVSDESHHHFLTLDLYTFWKSFELLDKNFREILSLKLFRDPWLLCPRVRNFSQRTWVLVSYSHIPIVDSEIPRESTYNSTWMTRAGWFNYLFLLGFNFFTLVLCPQYFVRPPLKPPPYTTARVHKRKKIRQLWDEPSTDPCGTPLMTRSGADVWPF